MFDVTPIKLESLGERLADELRRRIIVGELAAGTRLVEDGLAESFKVSRGPVRDALKILRAEGLVTGSGRNVMTGSLSEADISELMALREAFEVLAVEHAMAVNAEVLGRGLASALVDMEHAVVEQDATAFTTADIRFHSVFFRSAGLIRLDVVWNQFRPTFEGLLHASGKRLTDLAPSAQEHHELAGLITTGQVPRVRTELHRHLQTTCTRLQAAIPANRERENVR